MTTHALTNIQHSPKSYYIQNSEPLCLDYVLSIPPKPALDLLEYRRAATRRGHRPLLYMLLPRKSRRCDFPGYYCFPHIRARAGNRRAIVFTRIVVVIGMLLWRGVRRDGDGHARMVVVHLACYDGAAVAVAVGLCRHGHYRYRAHVLVSVHSVCRVPCLRLLLLLLLLLLLVQMM